MLDDRSHSCLAKRPSVSPLIQARIAETLSLLPRFRSLDPFELRTLVLYLDEVADVLDDMADQAERGDSRKI
jgi:hypothetical protein